MEIRVGDRVTYKYKEEVFERLVTCEKDLNEFRYGEKIEILKIERPKYEVVEKKELLTEKEREFLKGMLYFCKFNKDIKIIEFDGYKINFMIDEAEVIDYMYVKSEYFKGLKIDKTYELSELGLED